MTTNIQEIAAIDKPNTAGFRPGYDPRRNLSGRPRKTFTDIVTDFPEQRKVNVVEAQFVRAESGDTRAAEFLRDTQDGRPTQRMEVTDTSVADALRAEVLAALANAGAISYVDAEYTELPAPDIT